MLIRKGGIYRKIDAKNFEEYREKGYIKVESKKDETPKSEKKG